MEANQDDSAGENCSVGRKFGLPGWMAHNIERLNTVTDFEQYACSPPETEGFLAEYIGNADCPDLAESSNIEGLNNTVREKPALSIHLETEKQDTSTNQKLHSSPAGESKGLISPSYHSILDAIKHEDFYSSPDSTPCATPEPSPAPRRKISGQQDTVQTNPGKWFYLGNFKKPIRQNVRGQCFNIHSDKENRVKIIEKHNDATDRSTKEPKAKSGNGGMKLVISNFDINAISPTSW